MSKQMTINEARIIGINFAARGFGGEITEDSLGEAYRLLLDAAAPDMRLDVTLPMQEYYHPQTVRQLIDRYHATDAANILALVSIDPRYELDDDIDSPVESDPEFHGTPIVSYLARVI